jgi:23S rRNA (pseudouridine1915-N3)-methyltransferase
MKIDILCVGKVKEAEVRGMIAEYSKRLSKYCKLEILEVADEKTPDGASSKVEDEIRKKEGERLLKLVKEQAYVVALAIDGDMYNSEQLAARLERLGVEGVSHIQLIIGGSLGLHESVLARADHKLSFSKLTFPHQLMRVILLEQIYRSYRIISKEPYHK